ncbi:putative sterol glucosyltransferase [Elsinoe ampelina]|uniref:Putative sterol glucosyltransferase n=1 Tax=Elsinoe ampelina TaxID=302913 RepID=A0A6A6G1K8_9PEZI|nr:putative sterol glucosyltransferase [Elsinoe ampelina]
MPHNKIQMPLEPTSDDDEVPPPYEEIQDVVADIQDDGRIPISLNRRVAQRFSRSLRQRHTKQVRDPHAQTSWTIPMNIVIQIVGSRGDVQPFIALGCELRKFKHRVRIATHAKFEQFVKDSGLEFFSIGGNPEELMAYMVKNPSLIPSMISLRNGDIQRKRIMVAEMLEGCWRSCIEPVDDKPFVADAIIASPPSFALVHRAQALGIPLHIMFTMPWTSTKAFPHPLANIQAHGIDPGLAKYASYGIVEFLTWQGLGDVINKFRKNLDLEPVPAWEGSGLTETLNIPTTYCWSPALIPKPEDWASHLNISGFFFCNPPDYKPPVGIADFLSKGSMPIYIGFGSIVLEDPAGMTKIILEAVRTCGVRAIISRGWSKLDGDCGDDILFIDDCPHEWLFKHVSAVVHHGGAGTTACGLANGCPTTIIPFFGDLGRCYSEMPGSGHEKRSRKYRRPMKAENGVKTAAKTFHSFLPFDTMPCSIFTDQPATWRYKRRGIRLSRTATEILIEKGYIREKDLTSLETEPLHIENRRWDPITASSSSMIGMTTDMANHTFGIFKNPYDEIMASKSRAEVDKSGGETALRVAGSSTRSFGMMNVSLFKGTMVDLPLALTEGLKAVPKLYGEAPQKHGAVGGWMSGGVVAGKSFAHGMVDGITDLVKQPMQGSREGAVGLAKGLGKGMLGFTTKTAAASLGLVAYTADGICKSIHRSVAGTTRKLIAKRKHEEGVWLLQQTADHDMVETVVRKFDLLKNA